MVVFFLVWWTRTSATWSSRWRSLRYDKRPETSLADAQTVLARLRKLLAKDFAIEHATLQVEPEAPTCDPCDEPAEKSVIA